MSTHSGPFIWGPKFPYSDKSMSLVSLSLSEEQTKLSDHPGWLIGLSSKRVEQLVAGLLAIQQFNDKKLLAQLLNDPASTGRKEAEVMDTSMIEKRIPWIQTQNMRKLPK